MKLEKTYTLRQLITKLEALAAKHGDALPVYVEDADTWWLLAIGVIYEAADEGFDYPERIEIKTEYHGGQPKGHVDDVG